MKLTTIFLVVALFQTHANPVSKKDNTTVTINLENVRLEKVLNRIETITDYKFIYKDEDVNYQKRVTVNVNKKPLLEVLDDLFFNTKIQYKLSKKQIVLKPKKESKNEIPLKQNLTQTKFLVSGTILDENGQPLPGANVIEKGTANGATADFDGDFALNVASKNAILTVSFLGFETKEVPVNNQSQIKIVLKENLSELDEVVVVGFGSQKKETVVGSITQAKGEELLRAGNVGTVSEALSGLMPGVSTMQAAGQPGATQANITIRGQSTWTNNDPLFVVDGVERDFNDIDPNEIESISVLKDASATAVFGVKAANGVVVITTKRGKKGETKVSITSSWGIKEPTMNTNYYADYPTTLEAFNQAAMNDRKYESLVPQSVIDTWRDPNRDKRLYSYTTWINELLTTGKASQYNINVSGGNDFVKYFTSLGYQHDGDIFDFNKQKDFDPRTFQNRYNWRSNLDFNFSETTKFQVGLGGNFKQWSGNSVTRLTNNGIAPGGGDSFTRIWQTPLAGPQPILEDGRLTTIQGATVNPNFYRIEREGEWKRRSNTLITDFTLIQNITANLKASAKLSYNFSQGYNSSITGSPLFYYYDEDIDDFTLPDNPDAVEPPLQVNGESIGYSNSSLYYEFRLNYDKTFGDSHDVGIMGLFFRRKSQNNANFPRYEESWVGRATYGYKGKYLAEFNGAYNGNENWAPGLRFGFFPSAAVGWVVSKENWFEENVGFLDFLKFRYSYGEIGSDGGIGNDRFLYLSPWESRTNNNNAFFYGNPLINYGGGNYGVFREGTPAVLDNTWEKAIKQDLAVELATLNNRLRLQVELFDERRRDIIMQRNTIAPWFGNAAPKANIGETKNHGIDIEVKWNDRIGKDFEYFLRANMSLSESRVVERDDPPSTDAYRANAGKPIGWNSGLLSDGLYNSWNDLYNSPTSVWLTNDIAIPGMLSYVDYNGDGIINQNDVVPINNPSYPTKTYAFNLGFSYKNFSVNALFNGMFDISKSLGRIYLFEYESVSVNTFQLLNNEQRDAWSFSNPNGVHPALRTSANSHDTQASTYTNRSSNFLRFKTLEVKYKFGKRLNEAIGLFDSFELFANGNNLMTWSALPDEFDPEQRQLLVYPLVRRYNFGLRASF
ncbi:TonB-dependent receptor [Seonamhaeicola algicola]|nr:TonB-dependent receptor [Seonamhaeicola algicola]